jgi:hypothetical protein
MPTHECIVFSHLNAIFGVCSVSSFKIDVTFEGLVTNLDVFIEFLDGNAKITKRPRCIVNVAVYVFKFKLSNWYRTLVDIVLKANSGDIKSQIRNHFLLEINQNE